MKTALTPLFLATLLATPAMGEEAHADHSTPAPAVAAAHAHSAPVAAVTAEQALQALKDGNSRFVVEADRHERAGILRRCETFTGGQHPIASILSCADSRVPPEMVFDQGIGDLFVIRVAGNVADTDEIGTLEYGVGHLGTPLVVVMGHTKCGAVTAVVDGAKVGPNIQLLVDNIKPAADAIRANHPTLSGGPLVSATITQNVWQAIADVLTRSPQIAHLAREGKVQIVGAVYDLHSGGVQWLGRHPHEAALLPGTHVPAAAPVTAPGPSHSHGHAPAPSHPAATTPAVPAATPGPAPSPAHGGGHGGGHGQSDAGHGDAHVEHGGHPTTAATTQAVDAAGHNYVALAVCLAGSGALSGLVLRFLKTTGPVAHAEAAHAEASPKSETPAA